VLLDEAVPDADYLELIRHIEARYPVPVFVLSARSNPAHKITSMELGAEDFITKPIDINELSARIKAQLKLINKIKTSMLSPESGQTAGSFQFAHWTLDFNRHELRHIDDGLVDLTSGELEVLKALTLSAGKVLTREQLFNYTRGHSRDSLDRSVDVQISRIRQKLNDDEHQIIRTVRGVGYMLDTGIKQIN
jgi:two-component system OmpR family response regulator